MSVCVFMVGLIGVGLCFDYIFLKLGDLRGGGVCLDLRLTDDGGENNLINF